jgi:dynein heavy chain
MSGMEVLLEEVCEDLDPGLDTLFRKAVFIEEGVDKINFNGKTLMYDHNFKLILTCKHQNPHFLPEICIKLTVINFTVTFDGLEQ